MKQLAKEQAIIFTRKMWKRIEELMDDRTWHDYKPTHRKIPQEVYDAEVAYDEALRKTDAYLDKFRAGHCDDGSIIDMDEVERLSNAERDAYHRVLKVRHKHLNCTCKPYGDACPSCLAYSKLKYGDSIPFGGEGNE